MRVRSLRLCLRVTVSRHYASPQVTQRVSAAACGPAGTVHQMNRGSQRRRHGPAGEVHGNKRERGHRSKVHRINRGGVQPPEEQRRSRGRSIGSMEEGKERGGRESKVDQQAGHSRICGTLQVPDSHPRVCAFHVRIRA